MQKVIHNISWAAQGDLQISCDNSWTSAKWNQDKDLPENVYQTEDDRLYSFEVCEITCPECMLKIKNQK